MEAHGRHLTEAVCASSAEQEWREAREPRAPRAVCNAMLQVLADAREETLQLIDSSVLQGTGSGDSFAHVPTRRHSNLHPLLSVSRAGGEESKGASSAQRGRQLLPVGSGCC